MKLYDFRITLRKAEFTNGFTSIVFGGSDTIYAEQVVQASFADAQAIMAQISANEPRPHCAMLGMRHSKDRKPPGYNDNRKTTIFKQ